MVCGGEGRLLDAEGVGDGLLELTTEVRLMTGVELATTAGVGTGQLMSYQLGPSEVLGMKATSYVGALVSATLRAAMARTQLYGACSYP